MSAIEITGNSEEVNSADIPLEKPTGINPAQVINVPVSIGTAVTV